MVYLLAEAANLAGWLGVKDSDISFYLRMTPSLLLAIAFVILMVSIHSYAPERNRIWSHIGLAFAIIYAVMVTIVYFVVITVVVPQTAAGQAQQIGVLAFEFGSFLYAIDVLGYGFMCLSTLFASAVFTGHGLESWTRKALFVNGILAPVIPLQMVYAPLWKLAALWGLTFPTSTILLAVLFRRLLRSQTLAGG